MTTNIAPEENFVITPETVAEARRYLGRQLAAFRKAAGYTQQELAAPGRLAGYTRSAIANAETGRGSMHRSFWERCDEVLGAAGELLAAYEQLEALTRRYRQQAASNRNRVGDISGTTDRVSEGLGGIEALVAAVTGYGHAEPAEAIPDEPDPAPAVARAKRAYQAGRYREVIDDLSGLLHRLRTAQAHIVGRHRSRVHVLAADAYQVACSVMLKRGDVPLATLAAERSRAAAEASGDPLAAAASARAVTHALLADGHHRQACDFALAAAQRLRDDADLSTPATNAVYGALLLRAAVAAAHHEDRSTALQLLDEAEARATGLGHDANAYWTYFNPVNVALHRVHVAARLGDAGQAIDYATRIDLDLVSLAERQASLLIDLARAYTQWDKYDQAYQTMRAAEQAAPQEVTHSSSVRRLVHDLEQRAPTSVKTRVRQFAHRIGVTA